MKSLVAIVVLAAGKGSRFRGSNHKLVQPLGETCVLGATLDHAIASGMPVVVVTTEPLTAYVREHVASRDIVVLPAVDGDSREPLGMGYSIAAGVSARPDASGWLVLPGDMPMVSADTLKKVARSLGDHPIVYAQHHGLRGHPVGFDAELFSELVTLTGDEGARRLIARYPAFGVEVDDSGVLLDVDTEADLDRLRERALALVGGSAVPR